MTKYTHAEILEMRRLAIEEIAAEIKKEFRALGDDYDDDFRRHVGASTAEDRLRTYMTAGLTAKDLVGSGDER